MRARDIARRWIWDHGYRQAMIASDGVEYGESGKNFTEKQLDKVNDMRVSIAESTAKKWDISKKDRKDLPRRDHQQPQRSDD